MSWVDRRSDHPGDRGPLGRWIDEGARDVELEEHRSKGVRTRKVREPRTANRRRARLGSTIRST